MCRNAVNMVRQVADRAVGGAGGRRFFGVQGIDERGVPAHAPAAGDDRDAVRKSVLFHYSRDDAVRQLDGGVVHPAPGP